MSETDQKAAWVARVLGINIAPQPRGAVNYAKLLLEWRAAQQRARDSLDAFGDAFLGLEEVAADFRLDIVRNAVASLPSLLPEFGDALADDLDAAMSAATPAAIAEHLGDALATLASYRQRLAGIPKLARLAALAKRAVNLDLDVVGALDRTLGTIEQEVGARLSAASA